MANPRTRDTVGKLGGILVTLAVSALALRLSSWSSSHGKELTGAFWSCLIAAIICGLYYVFTLERPTDDPWKNAVRDASGNIILEVAEVTDASMSAGAKTQTARDNSGKMFQAEELHYHEAPSTPPLVPPPTATNLEPELVKIPQLIIRSHPTLCLANESQRLTRSEKGEPGMIVRVENPEAAVGQRGMAASGVVAIIRFVRPNDELAGISEYACWLDTYENQVTIEPGTSRELVIGIYSNPKVWKYFSNKRDSQLPTPRTASQVQAYMNRVMPPREPQLLLMNPTINAEISLLSRRNHYTLAKKAFKLFPIENALGQTINFMFEELE